MDKKFITLEGSEFNESIYGGLCNCLCWNSKTRRKVSIGSNYSDSLRCKYDCLQKGYRLGHCKPTYEQKEISIFDLYDSRIGGDIS